MTTTRRSGTPDLDGKFRDNELIRGRTDFVGVVDPIPRIQDDHELDVGAMSFSGATFEQQGNPMGLVGPDQEF